MKTSKNALRSIAVLGFMLVISSGIYAQHYRGFRSGHFYGYRPRVSIGIGYNPYYNFHSAPRVYYHSPYQIGYPYTHYGPAFGLRIGVLPFGYSQFFFGGNPYYYYAGIYYRPYDGGGYTVAPPPLGATVKHLPSGTKVTVIDGQKFYQLGGTFYQEKVTENNSVRYEVVGTDGVLNTGKANANEEDDQQAPPQGNVSPVPAEGTMVSQLPAGSTAVTISQQKYYLSPAGVYYQEMVDANNNITYKVAGSSASGVHEESNYSGT